MEDIINNSGQKEQNQPVINWKMIFETLLANWKKLFLTATIAFVVSGFLIFCVPDTFSTIVKLSPEYSRNQGSMGSLASLASTMGFDLSNVSSADAITPSMYPDIVHATDFAVGLFDVKISTQDNAFNGTYYNYLAEYQRKPFWTKAKDGALYGLTWIIGKVSGVSQKANDSDGSHPDLFHLSKKQKMVADLIGRKITCSVDKKTGIISLKVQAQDPVVCGNLADSARLHLESFITKYHTSKAINDMRYYQMLADSAKLEYDLACQKYFKYVDEHSGLSMERYKLEQRRIEDDMQLKYNVFSTFQKSYLAAQAKVQDSKPVFVILQASSIPTMKEAPSRVRFILLMTFLSLFIMSLYLVIGYIDFKRLFSPDDE